jgi:hypothetical protein
MAAVTYVLYTIIFLSCSKQEQSPIAVLHFRFEDRYEDVEWLEVTGSRYISSGNLYITAKGHDFELFHLGIENVSTVGLVQNVSYKNISYADNYGFITGSLQYVEIRIVEINNERIYGNFNVNFINRSPDSAIIKATGTFSILGKER